jgi:transcriptional regulator with XRE-family HTH domain
MEREAADFLRALRGRRSQVAWARRLGYRGNPITNWERGKRFPTATEVMRAARQAVPDVCTPFATLAPTIPFEAPLDRRAIAAWLDALSAGVSMNELAKRCGRSRFSVRRWLRGEAEPRLPDFFRLIDALTGRLPEWVAAFVPIENVPGLAERHAKSAAAKRIAFEAPWSEAILRMLETTPFLRLELHDARAIGRNSPIPEEAAARCLALLIESGIVQRARGKYKVTGGHSVDTQGGREALHRLKAHWTQVAAQRLQAPDPQADLFAYNVMSVSAADLERIREILRSAFREIRTLVTASEPADVVALVNLQLVKIFPLSPGNQGLP